MRIRRLGLAALCVLAGSLSLGRAFADEPEVLPTTVTPAVSGPSHVVIRTHHGQNLHGEIVGNPVVHVQLLESQLDIPFAQVVAIRLGSAEAPTYVALTNGDVIHGPGRIDTLELSTAWGRVRLNLEIVAELVRDEHIHWHQSTSFAGPRWTISQATSANQSTYVRPATYQSNSIRPFSVPTMHNSLDGSPSDHAPVVTGGTVGAGPIRPIGPAWDAPTSTTLPAIPSSAPPVSPAEFEWIW
ncbi:MAG: hypothetical protein KDA60_21580 [Planctomycetales bacterium]|nr:hypothetical protein [Planctomycetales bacterium]